jgi:predicted RNA-binding protein YlqC (UPF0109 family)
MEKSKQFLEYLVSQVVDNPSLVIVESKTDERGVLFTLHVAAPDMGKIIGKSGETAKAIRTLLRVVGSSEKARVNLKIAEPEGGSVSKY